MPLKFTKHEHISLREAPDFSEVWLHDKISEDTSILGIEGELEVVARERRQAAAGRLDMLLADRENEIRYEVEIMLGSTDPSHIIRCIEYWDIERRHYPAYDHVAVLVAEDITSRFLNVMSLLAGSIPLIAIQLNALKVGDSIILDFVKVLDQRALREDEAGEANAEHADRGTWDERVGSEIMRLCDRVADIANQVANPKLELKYLKHHVAICPPGSFFNVAALFPKKGFLPIRMSVADSESWMKKLKEAELQAESKKTGSVLIRIRAAEMAEQETILGGLIHQAVKEFEADRA